MMSLHEALRNWEAVIGLEVHCALTELSTKMFCGCKLEFGAPPNTHTCPVCLGLPGALPVPNKAAIESIVLAGLATNCDIMKRSMFYRKGYLYPDLAKGFQITQGPIAFCMNGYLDLPLGDGEPAGRARVAEGERTCGPAVVRIGIERIHLEEDAGKMIHVGGESGRIAGATHSLVDYNRAGTPLIELVTRPDLRTPGEARLFLQKLRQVFLALGISDCSMEKGSLRADGNVSLRRHGCTSRGVKTELKNINSFKHLHDALAYEICRQAEVLESGGVIRQETRHWSPVSKQTVVMRTKEALEDYRMFPDPDLAPYDLSDAFIEHIREKLPELPDHKAARFEADYGLPPTVAHRLVERRDWAAYFEEGMAHAGDAAQAYAKPLANLLLNEVAAMEGADAAFDHVASLLTPARAISLIALVVDGAISSRQGKEVLAAVLAEGKDPASVVEERHLKQVSDVGEIEAVVDRVLAAYPAQVEQYHAGKHGIIGFFVGRCIKEMQGQGNPRIVNRILAQKLDGFDEDAPSSRGAGTLH